MTINLALLRHYRKTFYLDKQLDLQRGTKYTPLAYFADGFVEVQDFFLLLSRDKSGGGREERCDEGKVIYRVFKLCLMKMKYYNLYNKLNCLSAIKLMFSDNTYI